MIGIWLTLVVMMLAAHPLVVIGLVGTADRVVHPGCSAAHLAAQRPYR